MIVRVQNGECNAFNESGAFQHRVKATGVLFANINGEQDRVAITTDEGSVEIRDVRGSLLTTVVNSGSAVQAVFSGDDVQVTYSDGSAELRSQRGVLIRKFY